MPREGYGLPEDQKKAARLRSLLQGLESRSPSRPVTARNQRKRLEKIRTEITNLVNREAAKLCCCRLITVGNGYNPDEFAAEMQRPCLVHGSRNLGHIVTWTCTTPDHDDLRLLDLVRQYRQGRMQHSDQITI